MARIITAIAPHKESITKRKNVAAYARVSSGKDAMLHSLSAQVSYYSELIQSHGDWKYAGVYADEAMTGTKMQRPEFQHMIDDCRAGKIDMVITKSISRFARNTVTLLETVRELKTKNVDVYFEEQNIHSMSEDGELMLTILASFAQEESLSVSENCKWRIRKDFQEGNPNTFQVFGYEVKNRQLSIIESEAEIVRKIFHDYLSGLGKVQIANNLNECGFRTRNGVLWNSKKVDTILKNEKYVGDLLLQKYYSLNHLEKKTVINMGQLPKYLVSNNHAEIIDRETYDAVQIMLKQRSKKSQHSNNEPYLFTGKIVCSICGKHYRHKINNVGTKYAASVWICQTYNTRGKKYCPSKQIPDDTLQSIAEKYDKEIKTIYACPENTLKIVFADGTEDEVIWEDKSRKWTVEMKAENYEKLRKGHK